MKLDINNPYDVMLANTHLAYFLGAETDERRGIGRLFYLDIAGYKDWRTTRELHFHEDWNWLMPVLIRIDQDDCRQIGIDAHKFLQEFTETSNSVLSNLLLAHVWTKVSEYVIGKYESGELKR